MAYVDKTKESMRDDYYNDKMYNAELFTMLMTHFATSQNLSIGPVYSIEGQIIGFVRKLLGDYIPMKKGIITLNSCFIPKAVTESLHKKRRIPLKVDSKAVRTKYAYLKMKELLTMDKIGLNHWKC
jgi:hypothetical protein